MIARSLFDEAAPVLARPERLWERLSGAEQTDKIVGRGGGRRWSTKKPAERRSERW
jgi:hypothetical protein